MASLIRDDRVRDCAAIAGFALMAAVLLAAFQNTPFIDDWAYAWSVEEFGRSGRLELLDISAQLNIAQVLWGWLFTVPFGFSFVALRWSTWTLGVAALCGFYLLLRRLDVGRRDALLGTATLALYPVFALLDVTFMTDVPFVSVTILATFAAVSALRAHSTAWLVAAALLGAVSIAIRYVGIVMPFALGATLLLTHDPWGRRRGRWVAALPPVLVLVCLMYWGRSHTHHVADLTWSPNTPSQRLSDLQWVPLLLPHMIVQTFTLLTTSLGLALLPLSLGSLGRPTMRPAAVIAIIVGGILVALRLAGVGYPLPLGTAATWRFDGLGFAPALVPFYQGRIFPTWAMWTSLMIAVVSIASAGACVLRRRSLRLGESFLIWMVLGHAGLVVLLWLINDRYVLVFVPLAIALLLAAQRGIHLGVALVGLACFAFASGAGIVDHLRYNGSLWAAVEALDRAGVPPSQIDGGYMVNGWRQYAHPEHAPRDERGGVNVPFVNGAADLPYRVANSVPDGWDVLERVAYRRLLGPSGYVYVLRRTRTESVPSPVTADPLK